MGNLEGYRNEIDALDDKIAELYKQRMEICRKVGEEKAKSNSPVNVAEREKNIINRVTKNVGDDIKVYTKQLFTTLFNTSKAYQSSFADNTSQTVNRIKTALSEGEKDFPVSATVACQGVQGAFSALAAERLFPISEISYFKNFDGVFNAVEKGFCEFGVLPIENSTAGSVLAVYDLMIKHKFYIVKSIKLPVQHCIAGVKGSSLKNIRTIISHEQALSQCKNIIKENNYDTVMCENTAVAARKVAELKDISTAAICSEESAEIYGLTVLKGAVQDKSNNHTRFICISKNLNIYKNSDKISIMVNVSHTPGSLNNILNRFATLGVNLSKLESRPLSNSDFEFLFYFDFDADIRQREVLNLLAELDSSVRDFVFLGSYKQI